MILNQDKFRHTQKDILTVSKSFGAKQGTFHGYAKSCNQKHLNKHIFHVSLTYRCVVANFVCRVIEM